MLAVIEKRKHEDLLLSILDILRQWPERERSVFSLAHYKGQSPEAISRSFKLEVEEVDAILKQCELRLHNALRSFLKRSCCNSSLNQDETARLAAFERDLRAAHALALKAIDIHNTRRISA
jgi:hypothetical protein